MKKERARERARNRSTRGIAQGAAAAAKKTQDGSGAATTTTITDGLPPPRPRASLRAAPEARAVGVGWWTSCVLVTLLGLPPFFSMFKCALDPWFSDILRPGPGSALLGDSGRMLMYEMRGEGLLSKLIGGPAWALGALMLGTGSLSVCLCWLGTARPQKITAYVTIVEGSLYILGAVYWTVTGAAELAPLLVLLGVAINAVSFWRFYSFLGPDETTAKHYNTYLACTWWGTAALCVQIAVHTCVFDTYAEEMQMLHKVRSHFYGNGLAWTDGRSFPDGMN